MITSQSSSKSGFSGSDIHVYVFRSSEDIRNFIGLEKEHVSNRKQADSQYSLASEIRDQLGRPPVLAGKETHGKKYVTTPSGETVQALTYDDEFSRKVLSDIAQSAENNAKAAQRAANDINKGIAIQPVGSLASFSYSAFREKIAVRTIGRSFPKGYTKGPRTVAGTMVFNIIEAHELIEKLGINDVTVLLDQINPFHMLITYSNEYGIFSAMMLFNVQFSTESQQMSVEDLIVRNSSNFYATDVLSVKNVSNNIQAYHNNLSQQDLSEMLRPATTDLVEKLSEVTGAGKETIDQRLARTRRGSL